MGPGWHLRPQAFAPQASVMAAGVRDDVTTSIPVSCEGVKTHVFMDDSIEFSGRRIASEGRGRSTLDFPLIRDAQSQDQP
jgi:hypothetical protein